MAGPTRRIAIGQVTYGGAHPHDYEMQTHKCTAAPCTQIHWGEAKLCLKCQLHVDERVAEEAAREVERRFEMQFFDEEEDKEVLVRGGLGGWAGPWVLERRSVRARGPSPESRESRESREGDVREANGSEYSYASPASTQASDIEFPLGRAGAAYGDGNEALKAPLDTRPSTAKQSSDTENISSQEQRETGLGTTLGKRRRE